MVTTECLMLRALCGCLCGSCKSVAVKIRLYFRLLCGPGAQKVFLRFGRIATFLQLQWLAQRKCRNRCSQASETSEGANQHEHDKGRPNSNCRYPYPFTWDMDICQGIQTTKNTKTYWNMPKNAAIHCRGSSRRRSSDVRGASLCELHFTQTCTTHAWGIHSSPSPVIARMVIVAEPHLNYCRRQERIKVAWSTGLWLWYKFPKFPRINMFQSKETQDPLVRVIVVRPASHIGVCLGATTTEGQCLSGTIELAWLSFPFMAMSSLPRVCLKRGLANSPSCQLSTALARFLWQCPCSFALPCGQHMQVAHGWTGVEFA